jgi:hypothetical protein
LPRYNNYGLGLWQNHIKRILAGWVGELTVPIHREPPRCGSAMRLPAMV